MLSDRLASIKNRSRVEALDVELRVLPTAKLASPIPDTDKKAMLVDGMVPGVATICCEFASIDRNTPPATPSSVIVACGSVGETAVIGVKPDTSMTLEIVLSV